MSTLPIIGRNYWSINTFTFSFEDKSLHLPSPLKKNKKKTQNTRNIWVIHSPYDHILNLIPYIFSRSFSIDSRLISNYGHSKNSIVELTLHKCLLKPKIQKNNQWLIWCGYGFEFSKTICLVCGFNVHYIIKTKSNQITMYFHLYYF